MGQFEVKRDCFAYQKNRGGEICNALKALYCKTEKCGFYKPVKKSCEGCTDKGRRYMDCKECKAKRN